MNSIKNTVALLVLVVMTMIAGTSVAQNTNSSNLTGSPYTRYGYGKLGSIGNAATRGMGDVGIAIRNNGYTTIANPASLTAIDTLTMIFSIGLDADYSTFTEYGQKDRDWNGGFSYMSLHFPLWRNFAMSLSLTPYTMVGYDYGAVDKIHLESAINKHDTLGIVGLFSGAGGVNNFMMGIGYRPYVSKMKELSIGANVGFLFGTLEHNASITTTSQANSTLVSHEMTVRGLFLQFGAQYTHRLNALRSITVGATFKPSLNMNVGTEEMKLSTDTITVEDKFRSGVKSPLKFGVGASYNVARNLMVSAEYEFTQWSEVKGFKTDLTAADEVYTNTHRFAVGAEYIPKAGSPRFWNNCRYRFGANTQNSYILTGSSRLRESSVSAGLSMPVNRRCFLDFSVGYSHLQPSQSDILKEDYLKFSLGITFNEMMFFRNRLR